MTAAVPQTKVEAEMTGREVRTGRGAVIGRMTAEAAAVVADMTVGRRAVEMTVVVAADAMTVDVKTAGRWMVAGAAADGRLADSTASAELARLVQGNRATRR